MALWVHISLTKKKPCLLSYSYAHIAQSREKHALLGFQRNSIIYYHYVMSQAFILVASA